MTDEEMSWFAPPGLLASGALPTYRHVPVSKPGANKEILAFLHEAEAAGEKVVLHCCAGQHRTGMILAAWLVDRHGLTAENAAKEVLSHASLCNVRRGVTAEKVAGFLEAP